ncbi:MAG: DUF1540 domain-containing protein [Bacillota bacterium]
MPYGQTPKADQRIYCTVAGCEFNENNEECILEGIHVDANEHGEPQTFCDSYRPR